MSPGMVRFDIIRSIRSGYLIRAIGADGAAVLSGPCALGIRYRSQSAAASAALAMGWIPSNVSV